MVILRTLKITLVRFSLTLFLVSCTSKRYICQIGGDDSYLNASSLKSLTIPKGISLSLQKGEYDIPLVKNNGALGKALDIRPPIQILSLLNDTHTENSLTSSRLFLRNTAENSDIWSQINYVLLKKAIKIVKKNDLERSLMTDWIIWPNGDSKILVQTKQKIHLDLQNNQIVITVSNEGIKKNEKIVTDLIAIQRYNALILNELIRSIHNLRNSKINLNAQ